MSSKPNIIFIIADDHRACSIGAYGCDEVSTPNLDALAERGTTFTNAHCQGGFNPAVCVPSRASLLSGRSVFELSNAVERNCNDFSAGAHIPDTMATVPERLRAAGYHTHAVGKWHNDKASFARGFTSAEKILFDGMSEHEQMHLQDHDASGRYNDDRARHIPGYSTDIFKEAALRFLSQADDKQPFFLYLAFTAPHDPRTPPSAFEVDPDTVSLPTAYAPVHPFDNGETVIRDELLNAFPRTPDDVRQHVADYYGMIHHLDDAVGQVLTECTARGFIESTVVVYTADHGLGLGNHGLMGKQNLYEHSLGIPLIFAGPSIPRQQRRNSLVWHADTHATLLSMAGETPDSDCAGTSLIPLMIGDESEPPRDYFGAAYRSSQRMIRDHRYKLIRYYRDEQADEDLESPTPGVQLEQLFDLESDPDELINLVFVPEYRSIRKRLRAALEQWQLNEHDHLDS